jgi:hypothetical protein
VNCPKCGRKLVCHGCISRKGGAAATGEAKRRSTAHYQRAVQIREAKRHAKANQQPTGTKETTL